ncbi:unnamed protein product, partial [Ascophyllum nodosum]
MTKSRKWSVRTSRVEPSVRQSCVDVSDNECELEDDYGGEDYRRSLFKKASLSFADVDDCDLDGDNQPQQTPVG